MKEATGELNMTVVTVVAIAAIGALLYTFVWPLIERQIMNNTCSTFGTGYTADKDDNGSWKCCNEGGTCYDAE